MCRLVSPGCDWQHMSGEYRSQVYTRLVVAAPAMHGVSALYGRASTNNSSSCRCVCWHPSCHLDVGWGG